MLTRKALDEALERARTEMQQVPPDGLLAYLADRLSKTITADENFGVVLARAYAIALNMDSQR